MIVGLNQNELCTEAQRNKILQDLDLQVTLVHQFIIGFALIMRTIQDPPNSFKEYYDPIKIQDTDTAEGK